MVGSEFSLNNMEEWLHPALYLWFFGIEHHLITTASLRPCPFFYDHGALIF